MAKKKKQSSSKNVVQQLNEADEQHKKNVEMYAKMVESIYKKAIDDLTVLASKIEMATDATEPFSFDKNPAISKDATEVIEKLCGRIQAIVEKGSKNEWLGACVKTDKFIEQVLNTTKLTKQTLQKYQDRNIEALNQFQQRKVNGLDLSDRIWKYVEPLKDEVEVVVDVTKFYKHGINSSKSMTKMDRAFGEGMSAAQLSREVRTCLKEPNKLFRRVRDKYGNLKLSKAAKLYHPGQGVYRSSYKNAVRMTRTEINMAYRQSDHMRWQQLDFVVGVKVSLSDMHSEWKDDRGNQMHDICDKLAGNYPKTFKFVGWHPQCKCFVTPITKSLEEVDKEVDKDGNYRSLPSANSVTDVPQAFKDYIVANDERMKGWKNIPYYIKDNPQFVDEALHPENYQKKPLVLDEDTFKRLSDFEMYGFNHQGSKLFNAALDEAKLAQLEGDLVRFEAAMAEMERIMKKNEASTASKAAKKGIAEEVHVKTKEEILEEDASVFTEAQKKNLKEIENIIGQKRGLRMSIDEADTGKENPNFHLSQEQYIEDPNGNYYDKKTGVRYSKNPKYKASYKGYTINCQTCVVAHEMRRRGFNVEADSNYRDKCIKVFEAAGITDSRTGKYLNEDGSPAVSMWVDKWQANRGNYHITEYHVTEFFDRFAKEPGRYEVGVTWHGGGSHVICMDRLEDGTMIFHDPQTGKNDDLKDLMKRAKLDRFRVLRVDDKLINPKIMSAFIKDGELPIDMSKFNAKSEEELRKERIQAAADKRHSARTKDQEQKLQEFWDNKKKESIEARKNAVKVVNSASGIVDAESIISEINSMLGDTYSIDKLRAKTNELKKVVDEFNTAMDEAKDIVSVLDGISDVDTKSVLDMKSIADVKSETNKLKDIKKQLESLTWIDDPIGVAKQFSMHDAVETDKKVGDKIAEFENIIPPSYWTGTQLEYQAKKLKFEAEEYLGTNKYGAQDKYKTWQVSQAAYFKKLDEVNKKIEIEKINASLYEWDAYISQHPGKSGKPSKIEVAIDNAKNFLQSGDLDKAKEQIAIAEQTKKINEASAASKAKAAAEKKAEKDYFKNVKKKVAELKKKVDVSSDDYTILLMIEDELTKDVPSKDVIDSLIDMVEPSPFGPEAYTQERRNKAAWFDNAKEANDRYFDEAVDLYKTITQEQRTAFGGYTGGSAYITEPLRAIPGHYYYDCSGKKGAKMRADIDAMTEALSKCKTKEDRWVKRDAGAWDFEYCFGVKDLNSYKDDYIKKAKYKAEINALDAKKEAISELESGASKSDLLAKYQKDIDKHQKEIDRIKGSCYDRSYTKAEHEDAIELLKAKIDAINNIKQGDEKKAFKDLQKKIEATQKKIDDPGLKTIDTSKEGYDASFMSCGDCKNTWFECTGTKDCVYNIYCPKGTQSVYAHPFSTCGAYGPGWDGITKPTVNNSNENEIILQRGSVMRIRSIRYDLRLKKWVVDIDLIGQNVRDYELKKDPSGYYCELK